MNTLLRRTLVSALLATVAHISFAADVGQHPAIFVARSLPAIDANTFIVGHPAGGAPGHARANHDHPAIATHRAARAVDPNTFLVQPPATTVWVNPSPSTTTAAL